VETAGRGNDLGSRSKHEVVGISENDLRFEFHEVAGLERFHCAERSDIHENGCFNRSMRGRQAPQTRPRAIILLYYLKTHAAYFIKNFSWALAQKAKIVYYSHC